LKSAKTPQLATGFFMLISTPTQPAKMRLDADTMTLDMVDLVI
jgi:hypothetical protein